MDERKEGLDAIAGQWTKKEKTCGQTVENSKSNGALRDEPGSVVEFYPEDFEAFFVFGELLPN